MKTNELRVKNYVYYRDKVREVTAVFDEYRNTIELEGYKTRIDLSRYNPPDPIKLTEQWLKDFKIKKIKVSGWVTEGATYWEKDGIVFYENGEKYYLAIGEKITNKFGTTVIRFDKVHELQNIFVLTGKELTKWYTTHDNTHEKNKAGLNPSL